MKTEKTLYKSLSNFILLDYSSDGAEYRYLLIDRYNENIRVIYRLIDPMQYNKLYKAGKMSLRLYRRMREAFLRFKTALDAKREDLLK